MPSSSFTPRERELIRREFCRHFGQDPSVADGILLRALLEDRRAMDPEWFAHLRRELELDAGEGAPD